MLGQYPVVPNSRVFRTRRPTLARVLQETARWLPHNLALETQGEIVGRDSGNTADVSAISTVGVSLCVPLRKTTQVTMKTTRTLALAALAALSLGVGTTLAQDSGGGFFRDDSSQQRQITAPAAVQSGSSDVESIGHGLTAAEILNRNLYVAGGVVG